MVLPMLGVFMDTRGGDAWGYTDGKTIHKETGEFQAGWTPEFRGALEVAIHTRHGTEGKNTPENAHPYDLGDGFIGMHNGIVDNHKALNAQYNRTCEVDSQNLLLHIKEGRDLSEVEAYGTVVFFRAGKLWLGSFNKGALAIAKTEWGIIFASTAWAIDNALHMAGLPEALHYNVTDGVLYFIEGGDLWISEEKLNVGTRRPVVAYSKRDWKREDTWAEYSWEGFDKEGIAHKPQLITKHTAAGAECQWCNSTTRELVDTSSGMLCGQCARFAASEDGDSAYNDDPFWEMTVREWEGYMPTTDAGMGMASCIDCSVTLLADDTCWVDGDDDQIIVCDTCHDRLINTTFGDAPSQSSNVIHTL
jgi:hypothetical protein